jgi:solute carrier family 9B (sodium/hydrogen exchanger), member 1/2
MAANLAELILLCLLADWACRRFGIPGLVGMLGVGMAMGPHGLNYFTPGFTSIGPDLRLIALLVILLRAGFEISRSTLHRVGLRATLLSFIPAVIEGAAVTLVAPGLLGLSRMESALLGTVLAAVSPAVVVPYMVRMIRERRGVRKGLPTMVLAASSLDDVFVIVVFSALLGFHIGKPVHLAWSIAGIPLSILLGMAGGGAVGWLLCGWFERFNPRATKRTLIVLALAVLLVRLEHALEGRIPFAALVAAMAIGFVMLERRERMAHELSAKLGKIWVFAEIVLFATVGAQVDVSVALDAGLGGAAVIGIGLAARALGVLLCLSGGGWTAAERWFVIIAYSPKATVQAAIGAAPLAALTLAGRPIGPGEIILAVAVLSILLTAPLGAWALDRLAPRLLPVEPHADPSAAHAANASAA